MRLPTYAECARWWFAPRAVPSPEAAAYADSAQMVRDLANEIGNVEMFRVYYVIWELSEELDKKARKE